MLIPCVLLSIIFSTLSQKSTAQQTTNLTSLVHYECRGSATFRLTRNGNPQNCAKAVLTGFPSDPEPGRFYRGDPRDPNPFSLPKTAVVGNCEVTLDLNGEGSVQGSWPYVWAMASTLNTACTYYRVADPNTAVTGGWMRMGQGGGLMLTIGRSRMMEREDGDDAVE